MSEKNLYHPEQDEFYKEAIEAMKRKFENYDYVQFVRNHERGCPAGKSRMTDGEITGVAEQLCNLTHAFINPEHQHGSFITHLRKGKLYSAMKAASTNNLQYFYFYMDFIYNEIPIHVLPPILSMI